MHLLHWPDPWKAACRSGTHSANMVQRCCRGANWPHGTSSPAQHRLLQVDRNHGFNTVPERAGHVLRATAVTAEC